jgi:hypothetical protein
VPVENFINSLMATPNPNGFEFPTLTEFLQAIQAVIAGGIVNFDPITSGSPFCPGDCSILPDSLNYPALVQDVSNIMPGNPIINEWLTAFNDPTGGPTLSFNGPTEEQILNSIQVLQQGPWDFGNAAPPAGSGPDLSSLAPSFYQLWTDLGLQPGQGGEAAAATMDPSALSSQLLAGLDSSTLSTDLSQLLAGLDPATLSADLSTLLANFASTLPADLASTLPASLLSLF